jgi:hypothetical protein
MLRALQAGLETTKGGAAIGELANILGVSKSQEDDATKDAAIGFSKPEMVEQKLSGMAAAAEAPNTPEHLRPHLRKLAGTSAPEQGAIIMLPGGQRGVVEYSSPHHTLPIVRIKTEEGKTVRLTRKKRLMR